MIIELDKHSKYLDELENIFTDVFTKEKVLFDINNNTFTRYYAYIIDSKAVAFINYYLIYERAELININVKEDYQNKKIGTKIMNKLVDKIEIIKKENPDLRVYLGASKGKEGFYRKFGFIERQDADLGAGMIYNK